MATTQEATLSVPDVSCGHCVQMINSTLSALAGVEAVSTDIATKSVQLRYDSNLVSMAQIEATLDDVGYTVAKEPRPMPRRTGKPLRLA
ncbi:copper chaperone CopZ [Reticulibacter mediterranei]|uniref:Copper chaperone CopZ n=1 Tax=Reticulibacter mediterranei TaxID=2778369 RepID=A0A8J3N3X5_9CHLR|nr:cation transporter [Reticulibacter mediterranei]GHO94675.1 copper chaperone CopZ [Reticulibacter mediterranei]